VLSFFFTSVLVLLLPVNQLSDVYLAEKQQVFALIRNGLEPSIYALEVSNLNITPPMRLFITLNIFIIYMDEHLRKIDHIRLEYFVTGDIF
jgi:hypothetical protein